VIFGYLMILCICTRYWFSEINDAICVACIVLYIGFDGVTEFNRILIEY
jgi:hypothetical protein